MGTSVLPPVAFRNESICFEGVFSEDQINYRLYANLPIVVAGVFANILNMIVFADSEMRRLLMNHFLFALSLSDLLLLVSNFCFLIFPVIAVLTNSFFLHNIYSEVLRISYPLALTFQTSGVYLTTLVSVHRFLGVCHPFRTKRWVTRRPVQYAIITSIVFAVAINITTWLELDVEPCFSERFQRMSEHIALTSLQRNYIYKFVKKVLTYTTVMFVIPFVTLIIVNWKIIRALQQSTNLRTLHTYSVKPEVQSPENIVKHFHVLKKAKYSEMFSTFSKLSNASIFKPELFKRKKFTNSLRDRSVTLMLLAIVGIFLVCNSLAFCNNIIEIFIRTQQGQEDSDVFSRSVEISNILVTVNSSSSIIVYYLFSSKYRNIVKAMLGLEQRIHFNRVAITTAVAAHRAVELSLIPDEAAGAKRLRYQATPSDERMSLNGRFMGSNAQSRRALFRSQTTLNRSITNSESNLKLMENEDAKSPH